MTIQTNKRAGPKIPDFVTIWDVILLHLLLCRIEFFLGGKRTLQDKICLVKLNDVISVEKLGEYFTMVLLPESKNRLFTSFLEHKNRWVFFLRYLHCYPFLRKQLHFAYLLEGKIVCICISSKAALQVLPLFHI